jgi:hypothetical protein
MRKVIILKWGNAKLNGKSITKTKARVTKTVIPDDIRTIIMEGCVVVTSTTDIIRIIPLRATPQENIGRKPTVRMVGDVEIVLSKEGAKRLSKTLDTWLKKEPKK